MPLLDPLVTLHANVTSCQSLMFSCNTYMSINWEIRSFRRELVIKSVATRQTFLSNFTVFQRRYFFMYLPKHLTRNLCSQKHWKSYFSQYCISTQTHTTRIPLYILYYPNFVSHLCSPQSRDGIP